ncbi:MAG: hypothetical protein C5B54_02615 [Acidobacteria bacterium]|nr:MAG: hypothetical protein C5B54_02615 [Acidobacteriota bacterium]
MKFSSERVGNHVSHITQFDYESVPSSVANFLKGQATRIRHYAGKSIIQIGRDLAAAKRYLSHGQFLRWIESEVGIPARTAQAYMQAAQWAAGKCANVALLPLSVLYVLSAKNTPKDFADQVFKRVEAGERLALPAVRAELAALREAAQRDRSVVEYVAVKSKACAERFDSVPHGEAALIEVVRMLYGMLSKSAFEHIRSILTNENVLDHPSLSDNIRNAFYRIDSERVNYRENCQDRSYGENCVI